MNWSISILEDVRLQGYDLLAMGIAFAFAAGLLWLSISMGWGAGMTVWCGSTTGWLVYESDYD